MPGFTVFDIIIVPAKHLVRLRTGQELGLCDEVSSGRKQTATSKIDGVMMREVHGSPPQPKSVDDEQRAQFREEVAHEESFQSRTSGMQRWEGSKHHWRCGECGGVEIDAKEPVDGGKTSRRTLHGVICRSQAIHVLVPGGRAWENELNHYTGKVHVSESSCKCGSATRGAEEEDEGRADERCAEVSDAIWQPGQDIKYDGFMCREDITEVGAIKDVFEGGQDAHPDRGSILARNESRYRLEVETAGFVDGRYELATEEEDQPCSNRQEWQKELAGYWQNQ